jgi:chaperonin cofactor prefoldin
MILLAPISVGELIDKITILEIKLDIITDNTKRGNVHRELDELNKILNNLALPNIAVQRKKLKTINNELWQIEDAKRECERIQQFDEFFIEQARQVYLKNDQRASIKREINVLCGSTIIEEKSHKTVA